MLAAGGRTIPEMRLLTGTSTRLLDLAILLLRCTVGVILFCVGASKVFGWFGGSGLAATIHDLVTKVGIPAPLAYTNCFVELIGGLLLMVGLLTRPVALLITINMLVATVVMWPNGVLAWAAYPLSLMISAVVILLAGPMAYSLDALLLSRQAARAGGPGWARPDRSSA